MELLYFAVVAVALYVFADFALRQTESLVGHRFEQRSLIFFGILLASALIVFAVIRNFAPALV